MKDESFYNIFKLLIIVFDTQTSNTTTYYYGGTMVQEDKLVKLHSFVSSGSWAKKFIDVESIINLNLGNSVVLDGIEYLSENLRPVIIEEIISNLTGKVQKRFVTMEQPLVTVL